MDMDLRADLYWRAFINEEEFPNGLAFRKALTQAKLDFSMQSLGRIDQLLNQIREKLKPEIDTFLSQPDNQEFVFLLGFYIGKVIAKKSFDPIKWLAYEELARLYEGVEKEYPPCFATTLTCLVGRDRLVVPLAMVVERLFNPDPTRTVRIIAERYVKVPVCELGFRVPEVQAQRKLSGFEATMQGAGFLAAQVMRNVSEGAKLIPTTSTHFENGRDVIKTLMMLNVDVALQAGRQTLEKNPDGAVGVVLVFDAVLRMADGPCNAMIIEVRTYKPQVTLMTLALPYRLKNSPSGFVVHQLKIIDANFPESASAHLIEQFFIGVNNNAIASQVWAKALDESM